jgi:3-oxoacyl-[acyl-carrier-protein] synthase II
MRRPDYDRRVVITGLGVVSPVGNDPQTAWKNLVNGVSGLVEITRFDVSQYEHKVGGEVKDFEPTEWMEYKDARRTDRSVHFAVAVAKQAIADSGLEINDGNRDDIGVVFGSGAGGARLLMDAVDGWRERGARAVSPFFIANMLVDSPSGQIAIDTGIRGHNMAVVTACSTGTHNLGEAAEAIRRGDCIAVVAGSTEVPLHEVVYVGFANMRGLGMPRPGEPLQTVARPFDLTRNGFVLGEGAAALLVEDLELAKARGARIYAEVVGYGSAADAHDMIQPVEKGDGSRRAMLMALERRGVPADEVDVINPHGTSTPLGDKREAEAIWGAFGDHTPDIAISATKSMTGHMMGASGAFEAFATAMTVYEQLVPPTLNYRDPDPECDLNIVAGTARPMRVRYALSNNIGLGGHNGAIILKHYED